MLVMLDARHSWFGPHSWCLALTQSSWKDSLSMFVSSSWLVCCHFTNVKLKQWMYQTYYQSIRLNWFLFSIFNRTIFLLTFFAVNTKTNGYVYGGRMSIHNVKHHNSLNSQLIFEWYEFLQMPTCIYDTWWLVSLKTVGSNYLVSH